MSTSPFFPKPSDGLPDAASNAMSRRPAVTKMRSGELRSPGQYETPRRETAPAPPRPPPGISRCQINFPVSASSATTLLPAGTYITPPTTIGTASEPPPSGDPCGETNLYAHDCLSVATLPVLISVSGENRLPARS